MVKPPNTGVPTQRNVSKSIVVHLNRKANIIQSFGRYTDVAKDIDSDDGDQPVKVGALPQKVEDMYKLEGSFDSLVP